MEERHEWDRPEMGWVAMDAADLDSEEASGMAADSYDVLVDKVRVCERDGGGEGVRVCVCVLGE